MNGHPNTHKIGALKATTDNHTSVVALLAAGCDDEPRQSIVRPLYEIYALLSSKRALFII